VIEARTEAESILGATARHRVIPTRERFHPPNAKIAASIAELRQAVSNDYKLIRQKIDELNRATEHLAELLMNSAVQSALEGKKLAEV
jgi:hypothetical protein